jgi:hypothetical protein
LHFVYFDAVTAVEATLARPYRRRASGKTDMHGARQPAPLLIIEIPRNELAFTHPQKHGEATHNTLTTLDSQGK